MFLYRNFVNNFALALFLSYSTSVCYGSCFGLPAIPGLRGCLVFGFFVPFDTSIEPKPCFDCRCSFDGTAGCCINKFSYRYPSYCKEVPDGPCQKKIVMRYNSSLPCDSFSAVGK